MTPFEYEYLSNFLLGKSGLSLGPGKEYLLEGRLIPLAQSWGLSGIEDLVKELRSKNDERLHSAVVEAMTTNETSFYRDKIPFEELKGNIIPAMIETRKVSRHLRIWCAAASTGQEPYSILMLIADNFPELRDWKIELVCTDIDRTALGRCEQGVYSQFEVQRGLPIQLLMKYFEQTDHGWKVKSDLGKRATWKQLNLLDNFTHLGTFDIVFCRNVLIYFQNSTKKDILDRIAKQMRPDGYLYLGAAETVLGISDAFSRNKAFKSAVYQPVTAAVPAKV